MVTERTFEGWEARIRPRGITRYFGAAFMGIWLCAWAVGELFTLAILVGGIWALVTGAPLHPSMPEIEGGTTLPVGGLLLLWLTLWTYGGISALWTFLRMLWGEDRIIVHTDGLRVVRRAGPFHRTRNFSREEIRRLYRTPGRGLLRHLMADTPRGAQIVTEFATLEELDQLEVELTRELALKPVTTFALPSGWEQYAVPEGGTALVESPAKRRRHAVFVAILAALCAVLTLWSVGAIPILGTILLGGLTALSGWGARRMFLGRYEWRWGGGRFRLDWRQNGKIRTVFEGVSLELVVSSDSDNDDWYELAVFETPPPESGLTTKRRKHKSIARTIRDPLVPRSLGEWLAHESGQPLLDGATSAALTEQTEELRKKLEASGVLGSWMAKMIPPPGGRK